jgi:adenosylmethionine-8-amino-7-oxononanoate aminotransferase
MSQDRNQRLVALDHAHVWHPFTPMRQWRESDPIIIEAGDGDELIDTRGNRYIDGVSSLWCNVHGHRVPAVDEAIKAQLDRIAHSTMLGLANVPATELAARLCAIAPGELNKVFYSDAGATATEVAFKMAMGYWYHTGKPQRDTFVALEGAYHGDTTGAMSIGYSDVFHRPFKSMVFRTEFVSPPATDAANGLTELDEKLSALEDRIAAIVVEPLVQGAAGMVMQPPGYLAGVAELCRKHETLLIADEVATGFGRTGRMFACEHEQVAPDIMCLGKGITGGYMPLAATLCTDPVAAAFEGELHEMKTLYHGHTYTGNPLACAAALASLDIFEATDLIKQVNRKAARLGRAACGAERPRSLSFRSRDPPARPDDRHRGGQSAISNQQSAI